MSWQTNPTVIGLRNIARKMGITPLIGRFLQNNKNYEQAFDDALLQAISSGDVVWDVGANVGFYTVKFAEAVGAQGQVFAFEPFPKTVARLNTAIEGHSHITVLPMALGAEKGTMQMQAGADDIGATSRILDSAAQGSATEEGVSEIRISTGDAVLETAMATVPAVIKIDTEGFEFDVLQGMEQLLKEPALKAVFIEVHFGLLAERGMADAPGRIEKRLAAFGLSPRWVDSSHIAGYRA